MDAVLEQAPVSGLAIACVEAVLEHGRLDVVAFVLFFSYPMRIMQVNEG